MRWAPRLLLTRGSGSSSGRSPLPGGGAAVVTTAKRWKQPPVHARTDAWTATGGKSERRNTFRPRRGCGSDTPRRERHAQWAGPHRAACEATPTTCPESEPRIQHPRGQEVDGAGGGEDARGRYVGRARFLERRKYYGIRRGDGRTALCTGVETADSRLGRRWERRQSCKPPTYPALQVTGEKNK